MKAHNKSNAQLVIETLLTGKSLTSSDISGMITERKISVKDTASVLARITNQEKCDLGYFVERTRAGAGFVYKMVNEALELSEEKAYGLTLKSEGKYTLVRAIEEFPELQKYAPSVKTAKSGKANDKTATSKKPDMKKAVAKPKSKAVKPDVKKAVVKPEDKAVKSDVKKAVVKPKNKAAKPDVEKTVIQAVLTPSDADKIAEKVMAGIIQKLVDGDSGINLKLVVKLEK